MTKTTFPAALPSRRREAFLMRLSGLFYPCLGIGLAIAAWELGVRLGHVPKYQLPTFSDAVAAAWTERGYLLPETWFTVQEILLGFALSVVVGIVLAVGIVSFRPVAKSIYPLLVTSQVVPKIAIAPVFLVWFGFGMTSKILIAFLLSFFPIVIDTVLGLRSARLETIHLARAMGAGWWRTFLHIRLPGALPSIFVGLKLAVTFSVTGAIVGEFVGADRGIGRAMLGASARLNTELLWAGVMYVTAVGFIAFYLMQAVERLAIPWHVSQRRSGRRGRRKTATAS